MDTLLFLIWELKLSDYKIDMTVQSFLEQSIDYISHRFLQYLGAKLI